MKLREEEIGLQVKHPEIDRHLYDLDGRDVLPVDATFMSNEDFNKMWERKAKESE